MKGDKGGILRRGMKTANVNDNTSPCHQKVMHVLFTFSFPLPATIIG